MKKLQRKIKKIEEEIAAPIKKAVGGKKPRKAMTEEHRKKFSDSAKKYQACLKKLKSQGLSHKEAVEGYRNLKAKGGAAGVDNFFKSM